MLAGTYIRRAAEHLVLDTLAAHPRGLTNARLSELTGLNPPLSSQRDYITWSILRDLVARGIVVKQGPRYFRSGDWRLGPLPARSTEP